MHPARNWASVACGLLLFFSGRSALANPSARLVYDRGAGAETCPDEAAIRAAVSARLGYDPFLSSAPSTMIVSITGTARSYHAVVKLVDGKGTVLGMRELEQPGPRCGGIIDTMALTMSIAIDPLSLSREGPPPAETKPEPPPAAAPTVAEPPAPPPPPPPPPPAPLHFDAGVGASVWVGAAPAVDLGGEGFARLRFTRASIAAELRIDAPASRTLAEGTVETWVTLGSVVPCLHQHAFSACAVVSLGAVHATSDANVHHEDSAFHAAVGPRLGFDLPLGDTFALFAHLQALILLTPQSLQLNGTGIYDLPRVSAGLTIGGSARFF